MSADAANESGVVEIKGGEGKDAKTESAADSKQPAGISRSLPAIQAAVVGTFSGSEASPASHVLDDAHRDALSEFMFACCT